MYGRVKRLENCRQSGLTSVTEIEIGRDVIILVNWIGAKRHTLLLENQDNLAGNAIDGVLPTLENISQTGIW